MHLKYGKPSTTRRRQHANISSAPSLIRGLMMKQIITRFLIGTMFFMVICFYGCTSDGERVASADAAIGVIETRGTEETSRIIFYDREMNEVSQLPLSYATLGGIFYDPLVYKGSLFAIPQGKYNVKDGESVLQIDLSSLVTKTYTIVQPAMNDVAASDKYVFTCNTLNSSSHINRCQIDNGEVSSVSIDGIYVSKIIWHEDSLYAFGLTLDDNSSIILHYDENMVLKESIDCSNYASSVYRAVVDGDRIYFCSFDNPGFAVGGQVGVLDTKDDTLSSIQLNEGGPSSLAFADGKLYVAHCNIMQGQNDSVLSIVNLETRSIEEHTLEHGTDQVIVTDGSIYVLGNRSIYRYDAEDMELIGSRSIEKMPGSYSYLSGLFSVR